LPRDRLGPIQESRKTAVDVELYQRLEVLDLIVGQWPTGLDAVPVLDALATAAGYRVLRVVYDVANVGSLAAFTRILRIAY
jgi:hypothetical protein